MHILTSLTLVLRMRLVQVLLVSIAAALVFGQLTTVSGYVVIEGEDLVWKLNNDSEYG